MHVDPTACTACGQPTGDAAAYACQACADHAAEQLDRIAQHTPAARDVAHGQARRGPTVAVGSGDRILVNLGATSRLDAAQNALTTWARLARDETRDPVIDHGDPLITAARYLAAHLEHLRHERYARDALRDIAAAARIVVALADPPTGRRYLGPCRAELPAGDCLADIYARDGASTATCRACGARVDVHERQAWIDGEARQHAYTAGEIAHAYGIRAGTIRVWANRLHRATGVPLLMPALVPLPDGAQGPLEVLRNDRGWPRYRVGDVLDLAATEAARRAEARARRTQREQDEHESLTCG